MKPLSKRLKQFPEYYFVKTNRWVKEYEEKTGHKVINLSIGSPDLAPTQEVIDELTKYANNPKMHVYASYSGLKELKVAIANYYNTRFGVELNSDTEVLPLIGSKEGIANFAFATIDAGDEVLVPDPGYSVYNTSTIMAGGKTVYYDLKEQNNFLPDIAQLETLVTPKTKIIWINYPNNPTGSLASLDDFKEIAEFADRHDLIVAHDNPYADTTFGGEKAPSFLQVDKTRSIEFNSLSKTYNMAGWRIGMAVGSAELVSGLLNIKSNIDTGIFLPIQYAAIKAFETSPDWIVQRNQIYKQRVDKVIEIATKLGLKPIMPKAALYVWCKSDAEDVEQFAYDTLQKTGILIVPGIAYGKSSATYVRISICQPIEILEEALKRLG